jgi:beta-xylosidase
LTFRRKNGWRVVVTTVTLLLALSPSAASAATGHVYPGDFPDPFVLRLGGSYMAYATQTGQINVQGMRSEDLSTWQGPRNVLPLLPLWAGWGKTWAPAVLQTGPAYRLYYTVQHAASGRQCISVASSTMPQGPFLDLSLSPWICQLDRAGSIDPYTFVEDDGTAYLLWKSDDNAVGRPSSLWGQQLSPDGLSLVGTPVQLLVQGQAWEAPAIEGPAMVREGANYYLFYGANDWDSPNYAIGYATCTGPLGPCTKVTTSGPWMASEGEAVGPGGPTFFEDAAGALHIGYHAWSPGRVGYAAGGARSLWIDRLTFVEGRPVKGGT